MDRVNLPQKTAKEELGHGKDQKNITEVIIDLLRQEATPDDDNPMDFHNFIVVFKEVVENNMTDSGKRLTCLIKFAKGCQGMTRMPRNCSLQDSEIRI